MKIRISKNWEYYSDRYKSLRGLLVFLLLSGVIVGLWKLFHIDEVLYGFLMPAQKFLISFQAPVTHWIVTNIFRIPATFNTDTLYFQNNQALQEQPLCTALKQVIQMTLILLFCRGSWRKKFWYIPLSSILLLIAAIFHLVLLALTLSKFPEHYSFMHNYISRWFFFGIYFLIWIFWEENFSNKSVLT